jgi:dihydrofolate reductase
MFNLLSVDGFFEGPNHEIDWHVVDEDFNADVHKRFKAVDTILFGRVTYQLMEQFWPTPQAARQDPITAGFMNENAKLVFSNTLTGTNWSNTTIVKNDPADYIAKLKSQSGKDMIILGSGMLVSTLAGHGLIDEFQFIICPVVLGAGKTLFSGQKNGFGLKLLDLKVYKSGNVFVRYEPLYK